MVFMVKERNDKCWCSQILDEWQQEVNLEMIQFDLRVSIMFCCSNRIWIYGFGDDIFGLGGFIVSQLVIVNISIFFDCFCFFCFIYLEIFCVLIVF